MVTLRLAESRTWLHARVGRRLPVERTREGERHRTNARVRASAATAALQPTVYLPVPPISGPTGNPLPA